MTRLLLCIATIIVLTTSANAQALIIGGGNSPSTHAAGVTRGNFPSASSYAVPKQIRPQQVRKSSIRKPYR
jgi:hypothetical protein